MKIYLHQVPETGLTAQAEFEPVSYGLDTEDVNVPGPLSIDYSLSLAGEELLAHLTIHCPRRLVCARCSTSFEDTFTKEVELSYETRGLREIDLTEDIRQEIVMEYPMKPLCRENCQGVCSKCGQDLNKEKCNCT